MNTMNTMNPTYYPEGMFPKSLRADEMTREQLKKACLEGTILEATARSATPQHDLLVDLGGIQGIIPRADTAIGIADGTVRDIAILSRVGKPVCFQIASVDGLYEPRPTLLLSRKAAQQEALHYLLHDIPTGTVLPAVVTHLDRFGAFCDIGCGNVSLLSIEHISISRINHSRDRFQEGQHIFVAIGSQDPVLGRINLTHKELLGTWQENAQNFSVGETVVGVVRSVKDYGVFIELSPNLSGLAEYREDLRPGDRVSVYIKAIVPERQKVKLIVIRTLPQDVPLPPLHYYKTSGSVQGWHYTRTPACC
ncbi:MAG: S1 RNA-binding domain-containing protein [Oscillospiraceae bacterium]|nr:S1 RNA-binding domain-containing protein [Oscillospiraceae bacterium]